ncbi:MAG: TatD family hydrolase [Chthoniobacterales bacterium]
MQLIETHAHLDDQKFSADLEDALARAQAAGVTRIISIGTNAEGNKKTLALADRYPSIYPAVGLHPTEVAREKLNLAALREAASHAKVVAIGEIGIDYYHRPEDMSSAAEADWKGAQAEAFCQQLDLAVELGLNVIIHQRDRQSGEAWDETLKLLKPYTGKLHAVFHCFGGTPAQAAELARLGHLVSFTGIITFKNAAIVRETAAAVAADGYMVETDSPYLAPMPYRGERAEPAHTRLVAEQVAVVRGISLEQVAAATTATAEKFFRFS